MEHKYIISKYKGFDGEVFDNLLGHLGTLAKKKGTKSLKITFDGTLDIGTFKMYQKQAEKYEFKVEWRYSPTHSKNNPAIDLIWTK